MEKLFEKKIVDDIKGRAQKEGLDKISIKELIIIVVDHFNDEISTVSDTLREQMKGVRAAGYYIAISVVIGIITYIITRFIP